MTACTQILTLNVYISIKPRDCFGKKRLAMTAILTLNKYNKVATGKQDDFGGSDEENRGWQYSFPLRQCVRQEIHQAGW
jgi:hypothetical protein